jgi:DNA-binding MarR family transcriptional regulator
MNRGDSKNLSDDDYRALGDFRASMRQFLDFSAEGAEAQGLTSQQHQALLCVRAHRGEKPIAIGELAESLLIKNHSAVGLVARLVERGFVSRAPSALDRRRVLVLLTPAGAEVLETISRRNLTQLERSAASLRRLLRALKGLKAAGANR